ncbi:MAG TPA: DUF222 domain-containing protein [Kribbella sp.]
MDVLGGRAVVSLGDHELMPALDALDADIIRLQGLRLQLIARIENTGHAQELGARDTIELVSLRHRRDRAEVWRDVRLARALPKYDAVDTALTHGIEVHTEPDAQDTDAGDDGVRSVRPMQTAHAVAIVSELERVRSRVPVEDLDIVEHQLVQLAAHLSPTELRTAAKEICNLLDSDGPEPDERKAYERETLTLTTADKGVKFKGYLANENAELLRAVVHAGARPHKTTDGEPDPRPRDKRQADALTTALTIAANAWDTNTPTSPNTKPTAAGSTTQGATTKSPNANATAPHPSPRATAPSTSDATTNTTPNLTPATPANSDADKPAAGPADGLAEASVGGLAEGSAGGLANGSAEGSAVGSANGLADGPADGLAEGPAGGLANGSAGGLANGSAVGSANGLADGPADRLADGSAGGSAGGSADGSADGPADRLADGPADRLADGSAGGSAGGSANGLAEGSAGGSANGLADGSADGPADRLADGPVDRLADGSAVGSGDGLAEGLAVGSADGLANGLTAAAAGSAAVGAGAGAGAAGGAGGGGAGKRGWAPGYGAKACITVTIDLQDLKAATADATGQTVYGDALSAATIRRLACDAKIIPIVLGSNSEPLDVGRCERLVTKAMRFTLNARDRGCVVCGAPPIMCDAHHLISWIDGGETKINNLALLCRRHHVDLHNGRFTITITNGLVHVTRPTWADPPPLRLPKPPHSPPHPIPAPPNPPATNPARRDPASADPARVERTHADPARLDPAHADSRRLDPAHADPARLERAHGDPGRLERAHGDSGCSEPSDGTVARVHPPGIGREPVDSQSQPLAPAEDPWSGTVLPAATTTGIRAGRWKADAATYAEAARFAVWGTTTTNEPGTGPPSFATI